MSAKLCPLPVSLTPFQRVGLQKHFRNSRAKLGGAHEKHRVWCDGKTRERALCPKDKVVVLRPTEGSELQLAWSGPVDLLRQPWKVERTSIKKAPHAAAKH